jgi:hypothetical protein
MTSETTTQTTTDGKVMLRAEFQGAVKERPLGARHYTHAFAYVTRDGEVKFPTFTTNPHSLADRLANFRAQGYVAEVVPVTERIIPARSAKAAAAARRSGRTRQLRNRCESAAWNINAQIWSYRFPGETEDAANARHDKRVEEIITRIIEAKRALEAHLADPTSGTEA